MTVYNKASLVLAESPAYKAGKIQPYYPLTPDVSFDFTRSTSATRVNADGNIEKETQNLLVQSNTFDTTWSLLNSQVTSGQSGYDGSSDAWLLERSGSGANVFIRSTTITASGICTISIYAKADNSNWLVIQDSGSSNVLCYFDLSNGTLGFASPAIIDKQITSIGNGWYRCSITTNRSSGLVQFYVATANQSLSGASDAALYIQDAQLEQGLVARNYQETTTAAFYGGITDNIPRLDYTDSSCPALLLEPQRTNSANYSEYHSSGDYLNNYVSVIDNEAISPEGIQNAAKIVLDSGTNSINGGHYLTNASTPSQKYTISVFAKAAGYRYFTFTYGSTNAAGGHFDLQEGVKLGDITNAQYTNTSASIEDYGDGWYRLIVSVTDTSSAGRYLSMRPSPTASVPSNNNYSSTGDGTSGAYIYGFQLEIGENYATSYIPTYGTSVTRNADAFQNSTNDKPLGAIGQGTWFVELQKLGDDTNQALYLAPTTSNTQQIRLHFDVTNARFRDAVNGYATIGGGVNVKTSMTKMALSIDTTSGIAKVYVNGSQLGSDYTLQANTFEFSRIVAEGKGFILKQSLFFPTALTDDECVALTTL